MKWKDFFISVLAGTICGVFVEILLCSTSLDVTPIRIIGFLTGAISGLAIYLVRRY